MIEMLKKPYHHYSEMNSIIEASIEQQSPDINVTAATVQSFFRAG
jgi:hypothetical protein